MHIIIFPWYQRLFLISPYHSRFWLLMPQFTFKIRSAHGSNSSGSISTYSTSIASMSSLPVLLRSIGSDSALGQRLSGSRLGCYARGFLFSEGRIVHLRRRDRGSWPYKAMRIVRVRFSQIHRIRVHRICWLTMIYSWRLHLNHQHFDGYIHKTRVLRYVSRGLCTKRTSLKKQWRSGTRTLAVYLYIKTLQQITSKVMYMHKNRPFTYSFYLCFLLNVRKETDWIRLWNCLLNMGRGFLTVYLMVESNDGGKLKPITILYFITFKMNINCINVRYVRCLCM